jgi:sugar phosphate isomerase/epimerase
MYFTGFADEAADRLEDQIRATRELGWRWIESRKIGTANIHDLPDADFERVVEALAGSGIGINCFGSAIANWGKPIDQPVASSLAEVRRAIPRMQRLGARLVRIMSFAILPGRGPEDQMEAERFERLRVITGMFADAGIQAVHENCNNYGGMGWTYTRRLLDQVPGLKLVFDTGNPVHDDDRARGPGADGAVPKQSSWEFYEHVRDAIAYVHIKDAVWDKATRQCRHTFPGEGQGDVRRILADLLARGYDGGFSIEPHLAVVHHDPSITSPDAIRYVNYVDYGKRWMQLFAETAGPAALANALAGNPRPGRPAGLASAGQA